MQRIRPKVLCQWMAALAAVGTSAVCLAQDASTSGMAQGEAVINIRSEVKLSIKGTRSTTVARLEQLTGVVTGQMPDLRKCYRELIAKHATTVGSLGIRITLDEGASPVGLEIKEMGGTEPKLKACVSRVLERAAFGKVGRPAAAVATLEFDNTRAKGQTEMTERMQVTDKLDVRDAAAGGYEGSWSTTDGKVAFVVTSKASKDAVEPVLRTLRDSYPGFADCRRRSEKDGLSPVGELKVEVQLQRAGAASAKVASSSVAHERAVPCVERAFKKLRFDKAPAGQRVQVHVRFGP